MTRSASLQAKARRECFQTHHQCDERGAFMTCHICGGRIEIATEGWEADHPLVHAFGGVEVLPAHIKCHRRKTSEEDVPKIAKSKRVSEKHFGIRRKGASWPKRKFQNYVREE